MDSHHKLGVPNAPVELLITPCNPGDMSQVSVSTEILKFVSIILNTVFFLLNPTGLETALFWIQVLQSK